VVAPPGSARIVRRWTGRRVIEAAAGERVRLGSAEVAVAPAEHDGRRLPLGPEMPAVAYVVEGSLRVAFSATPTCSTTWAAFSAISRSRCCRSGGGGRARGPGHLGPERAARAAALLTPQIAVPIHWGAAAGPRVWWRADPVAPAKRFADLVAVHTVDVSAVSVKSIAHGTLAHAAGAHPPLV
jgi:L-ascorbate metabolism protein UlaG (beta-lactamase superfamily)